MDKFDFLPKVHFTSFYEQQSGITKTESPEPGNLFLPYWAPSGDDEIWSGQPCRLDFGDLRRFHLWSSEIQNPKCKLFDYWEIWYYPFFFYFKWFLEQQTVGLQQEETFWSGVQTCRWIMTEYYKPNKETPVCVRPHNHWQLRDGWSGYIIWYNCAQQLPPWGDQPSNWPHL